MVVVVIGVLAVLMGIVWALQGLGVLLGSFMSNDPAWIAIGAVTAAIGALLVIVGIRTGPPAQNP
jgi:hypothetical protein